MINGLRRMKEINKSEQTNQNKSVNGEINMHTFSISPALNTFTDLTHLDLCNLKQGSDCL